MTRLHKRLAGAALAMLTATAAIADYPERPIKMVIPYGAGGATDISARSIAGPLGDAVGKPLVMANVTGAGGATGSVAVQNALLPVQSRQHPALQAWTNLLRK